jgi:NADH:ubiquinone oxidoreductase subunit 6 (subunit J)
MTPSVPDLMFYGFAALVLASGALVAFSRNIVHSGFALLGVFAGVAGLFGLASATFIAAAQLIVYVGGVLVVILFAVMLTKGIGDPKRSNPAIHPVPAIALSVGMTALCILAALSFQGNAPPPESPDTVAPLGDALLGTYLLPFEFLSLLLLAVLVGAVMTVRKEIKPGKEEGA